VADVRASRLQSLSSRIDRVPRWFRQLVVFACVGGVLNVVYGLLYVVLRDPMGKQWSNAVTLIVTTIASTATNRWLTFGVRGPRKALRHQVLGFALLAFGLGVTAGSLWLLDATTTSPGAWAELAVLAAANLTVGLVRFVSFKVAMVPEPVPGPAQPVTR
jgi:putative flippase GtrA